jgi:hypothetical protein
MAEPQSVQPDLSAGDSLELARLAAAGVVVMALFAIGMS